MDYSGKYGYGFNVIQNGRNFNAVRLLTGGDAGKNGHRLTAINFSFKDTTVLIILKKDTPTGAKVAFLEASSLDDALYVLATTIKSKTVPWRDDRWKG